MVRSLFPSFLHLVLTPPSGADWTKQSQQCVEGEEGRKLARQSAKRLSELGVEKSCSILVRGEVVWYVTRSFSHLWVFVWKVRTRC